MTETTETTKETSTNNAEAPKAPAFAVRAKVTATINALVDRGTILASNGLGYLKVAVENGARTLERAAKALETYQERFKKDDPKPVA